MPWRLSTRTVAASSTRTDHRGDAAVQERNAAALRPLRRQEHISRPQRPGRDPRRGKPQHGGKPRPADRGEERRQRPGDACAAQREPKASVVRQHERQQRPQQAIRQRAAIGRFDMGAGVVDEVHVVHARGTGGHASEAGEAAVDMLDHFGGGRPALLQHVLDQVDAPARAIEFIAEQHIGRAGRGAEAAMHAGSQDLVGFRDIRVGELREGERSLHCSRLVMSVGRAVTPRPTSVRD